MANNLSLSIYNLAGKSVGSVDLDPSIFDVKTNKQLLHQAIVTHLANRRATTAQVKDRSDVRGGGKKPWRQKGTGNARVGSTRSPLWRGGGITFGPSNERNYSLRMPQKMRQAAMKAALSAKVADGKLLIIDSFDQLNGQTKSWNAAYALLPNLAKNMLIVDGTKQDLADRSIRNMPDQKYVGIEGLTTYDIMRFPGLIMSSAALEALTKRLGSDAKASTKSAKAGANV